MSVPAAYFGVILIWSTTPLAVKWSGEGPGFLFGALGRMVLAALLCLAILAALRVKLPWHQEARRTYAAAAVGVYGAMLCIYWGAQYIPSGIIAVLFGLTPMVTAILARVVLRERGFTPAKLAGMAFGLVGLGVIFGTGARLGARAVDGVALVLLGVLLHSISTVLVKRANESLPGLTVATGALLFVAPLFFLTWLALDGAPPVALPVHALASIVYLGVIGSAVGFTLYYYVLKHSEANATALVTLVSPVLALILGNIVNHEHIGLTVWSGAGLVLSGLVLHQWGNVLARRRPALARGRSGR